MQQLTWTLQADCDDVDALKAILSGLKARHEKTGDLPLLIHTVSLLPPLIVSNRHTHLAALSVVRNGCDHG